jgi:hypothetical protein
MTERKFKAKVHLKRVITNDAHRTFHIEMITTPGLLWGKTAVQAGLTFEEMTEFLNGIVRNGEEVHVTIGHKRSH